jgi:PilZ domain-containing protein
MALMADLSHTSFRRSRQNPKSEAEIAVEREAVNRRLAGIINAKPVATPPEFASAQENRRRQPRKTTFKLARIFVNKIDSIRCVIINLSADGARISIEGDFDMPQYVVLKFEETGIQKKARIAWQHENEFGLSFLREEKTKAEKSDSAIGYKSDDYSF